MPLQQIQMKRELPDDSSNGSSPQPTGIQFPEGEKPNFWIWVIIAFIILLLMSAGIYFWIFK